MRQGKRKSIGEKPTRIGKVKVLTADGDIEITMFGDEVWFIRNSPQKASRIHL